MEPVRDAVAGLVGDIATITARRPRAIVRLARSAMAGRESGIDLVVDDHVSGLRPFVVVLPNDDDLLPEVIAEAISTAVGLRNRFGEAVAAMRRMSFDHSDSRMRTGHIAGNAHLNMSVMHLNATYITASGVASEQRRTGRPPVPMVVLVSHEMWHLIELAWEVRDYRATIAFRREVGAHFGVETIEHAVRNDERALGQLRSEVSDYAATSPKEATAEMFEQWWTRAEHSPAVAHFGALVDRYFPT